MVMVFVELGMSMVLKGVVAGCCLRSGQSGGMDGSWCEEFEATALPEV
ncbi:proline-rich receptor-like protein kinase PERK9 [Iris pallida]|uniref:Proline-rich receptor-like protein kinase PERK9 n=1 Tax=Iris pallida TaxID=29817 RepID=A0AAX6DRQ9_IRIPA|nr:proline-rich receptor-like protein kinase PERK9 [Iris pallida]